MSDNMSAFWVFATEIGNVGIAWSDVGVTRVEIATTERTTGAAPAWVRGVAEKIRGHFAGHAQEFSEVPLDWSAVTPFRRRVYEAARAIPSGATATYGDVARTIGASGAARAVGQALGRNPFGIIVPCHRVVAAGGKMGGFSAPRGIELKRKMLGIEAAFEC
ncbi:MAG: MGMT family protein [Deltaproteobacteria bacterium]|nr:MGMT family protein [Deltaproteobacteria bacterium]